MTQTENFVEMQQDVLKDFLRRERAAANMKRFRERQKATEPDEQAGSSNGSGGAAMTEAEKDEWQRRANLAILRGEIKLPGRR